MTFMLVDAFIYVLYGLKWLALVLALLMLMCGLDDLFLDVYYWTRRFWRSRTVYQQHSHANEERLFEQPEKPLAVMVPAWQEVGVVGSMAQLMANTMDYENYQIFVGTYPNDPETQAEVDVVARTFHNVHKVVTARPGPTSKADCLNNIVQAIADFEEAAGIEFAGCILHDAEDVISPMELRMFNYMLPDKDLIQVPVYPFRPRWYQLSSGHYIDEFSEYHGKDVVTREAITGQVPSAGVGTCFSRRALTLLRELNDGVTFDIWSLTEDYDIGFRLHESGLTCAFVRYSVDDDNLSPHREHRKGQRYHDSRVICVREHFPTDFKAVIRQKSRWITGIVFQGYQHLGWSNNWRLNYFLWRDRRGVVAYPVALIASCLLIVLVSLWLAAILLPDAWRFPDILSGGLLSTLLMINGVLLINRAFQRFYFVKIYYGWRQGILSFPRMLWSNIINFLANVRAWRLFMQRARHQTFAWDKTTHEFPHVELPVEVPLEDFLLEDGVITQQQLTTFKAQSILREEGREMLVQQLITGRQQVAALARKHDMQWRSINPLALAEDLVARVPTATAMRYAILPIGEQGDILQLATEAPLTPVAIGAICRRLKCRVEVYLVPIGRVTLGLRHWHLNRLPDQQERRITSWQPEDDNGEAHLDAYCCHQVLLGQVLVERGWLSNTLFIQAMIDFDPQQQRLGDFLLQRGMIDASVLDQALEVLAGEERLARQLLEEQVV
ncbi:type II secretion system protein E [Halomonas huangheensis]|nr:type II secretion system protein E [Halomonas huangheensis]